MTFREFWPAYLRAHRRRGTRIAHYAATALGLGGVALALFSRQPWIALAAIGLGYLIAVASHRLIEGRASLVRLNPIWGAIGDLRMCWLALRGGLAAELRRSHAIDRPAGVAPEGTAPARR